MRLKRRVTVLALAAVIACTATGSIGLAAGCCGEEPTGTLAFSSVRDGNSDICIMDADGTNLTVVPVGTTRELEPSWAPDGQRIAFQSQRPSWGIYTALLDGTGEVRVVSPLSWSPNWSPDGAWIAFSTGAAIYRADPCGARPELLVSARSCGRPCWSPDGQSIAFHSAMSGNQEIYILDLRDGRMTQVTDHPGRDLFASWSPAGDQLVFASDRDGDLEIYTVNVDGTDVSQLTDNDAEDMLPAWSPDGRWIAFVSDRDGNQEIYVMRTDGLCPVRLTTNPGDDMYPAWKPMADG